MFAVAFFSAVNTLGPVPIDKVLFFFVALLGFIRFGLEKVTATFFTVALVIYITTFFINTTSEEVSLLVFFPFAGFLFIYYGLRFFSLSSLYYSLFFHFIIALALLISGYITHGNLYVHFLYDKGLPFLAAPMGLTSTTQTFGTICMAWLILFYTRWQLGIHKRYEWIMLAFVFCLILSTFNRMTYVTLLVFFFIHKPKAILAIGISLAALIAFFADIIISIVGASGTVMSRFKYLSHYTDAILTGTPIQILFGHSNHKIFDPLLLKIRNQPIIENGIFSLLFTYGFIFLLFLIAGLILYVVSSKSGDQLKSRLFAAYFIFPAQILTTEYFSSSFYLFLLTVILSYKILAEESLKKTPSIIASH